MGEINNGSVTGELVGQWKAQYRKVLEIIVDDEGDRHAAYFKRPNMETLAAVNKLAKTDEVKAAMLLYDQCYLGGSPAINDDAILKMAVTGRISELMQVQKVETKNL